MLKRHFKGLFTQYAIQQVKSHVKTDMDKHFGCIQWALFNDR